MRGASTRLAARILATLALAPRTTAQMVAALAHDEREIQRTGYLLLASGQVERSVRQHWRRAPEPGWAEWVWRLP